MTRLQTLTPDARRADGAAHSYRQQISGVGDAEKRRQEALAHNREVLRRAQANIEALEAEGPESVRRVA